MERLKREGLSDGELLARIHAGDADALDILLERYYQTIFGYAFRYSGSVDEAEDIVQEALLKIARSIRNFEGKSELSTWIYRVAVNAAHDQYKKRKRSQALAARYQEELELQPTAPEEPNAEILGVLSVLGDGEKQAVLLVYYEGLNHAAAAKVLGCAESTVSWRLFVAKKKIRKELKLRGAV